MKVDYIIRFAGCFYATCDSIELINGTLSKQSKNRLNIFRNGANNLLKDITKGMNPEQADKFEKESELVHNVINEIYLCKDPKIMLELMKEFNRGNVRIEC